VRVLLEEYDGRDAVVIQSLDQPEERA
jgi:hypothetical protein